MSFFYRTRIDTTGRRPLLAEHLETRHLLAGLVEAILLPTGDLQLLGDEADNAVGLTQAGESLVVASLDGTTTINGHSEITIDVAAIGGNLLVELGNGNDTFHLGGETHDTETPPAFSGADQHEDGTEHEDEHARLTFAGNVVILTGNDDDSVKVRFLNIDGDLLVETGNGHDVLDVGRGPGFGEHDDTDHVTGQPTPTDTTIPAAYSDNTSHDGDTPHDDSGGCGDEGGPPADVAIGGRVAIDTGRGVDAVKLSFVRIGLDLSVMLGTDNDQFVIGRGPIRGEHGPGGDDGGCGGHETITASATQSDNEHGDGRKPDTRIGAQAVINLGPGDDFAMLRNARIGSDLVVMGLAGNDAIGSQNLRVHADATIVTHAGDDAVVLRESRFMGRLTLLTGPGSDLVFLAGQQSAGDVRINMGTAGDFLVVRDSVFAAEVLLLGGGGLDVGVWEDLGNLFAAGVIDKAFENHVPLDVDWAEQWATGLFAGFWQGGNH